MNTDNRTRRLHCSKEESGVFFRGKDKDKEVVGDEEFNKAIQQWKIEDSRIMMRYVSGAGIGDYERVSRFYKKPTIGEYLSRREIEVGNLNIPVVNPFEKQLYSELSSCGFTGIPYRTAHPSFEREANIIAKAKDTTILQLDSIDIFNIIGASTRYRDLILELNAKRFKHLKKKHCEQYKGLHYNKTALNIKDLKKFIKKIEEREFTEFDDGPQNLIVSYLQNKSNDHGVCCILVVSTDNVEKPKVIKIMGFNSWSRGHSSCPIVQIGELLKETSGDNSAIEVEAIYYGAQANGENPWDSDGNCVIYAFNAMNTLTELLISEGSRMRRLIIQDKFGLYKAIFKRNFKENLKPTIAYTCILGLGLKAMDLRGVVLLNNDFIIKCLVIVSFLFYFAFTMLDYFSYSFSPKEISKWIKWELMNEMPHYFKLKDSTIELRSWEERVDSHIKDRWLIGNAWIENRVGC